MFSLNRRPFALTLLLALVITAGGCSTNSDKKDDVKAPPEKPAQELFDAGQKELEKHHYVAASENFDELDRQHPYSDLAPKAKLLSAYAQYLKEDYDDAIAGFDKFLQMHPGNPEAPYAQYLKALCYYEQISDVSRDQGMTTKAMEALELVSTRYPDSPYAKEAKLKLDLTRDHLAGKEMEIGRWYQRQNQLQAAIGRFRSVVDSYQTTSHVPEALHRLVECYMALGLKQEARQTALVLGKNYPGSPWYQDTYALVSGDPDAKPADSAKPGFFKRTLGSVF